MSFHYFKKFRSHFLNDGFLQIVSIQTFGNGFY